MVLRGHYEGLSHEGEPPAGQEPRHEAGGDAALPQPGEVPHLRRVHLGLGDPLGLGSPVLEPDLDLCLGELELGGELGPLGDGQVLLLPELLLQAVQLLGREGRPRLPVRLVLPQRAAQGTHGGPGV